MTDSRTGFTATAARLVEAVHGIDQRRAIVIGNPPVVGFFEMRYNSKWVANG